MQFQLKRLATGGILLIFVLMLVLSGCDGQDAPGDADLVAAASDDGEVAVADENVANTAPATIDRIPPPVDEALILSRPEQPALNRDLIQAISADNEAGAIELIREGASVTATNERGMPILFLAVAGCRECSGAMPELTELLLANGVNPDMEVSGARPIHWAARAAGSGTPRTWETIELLARHGADLNTPDRRGNRPLYYAARSRNVELVQFMLELGATME
jgi:hypothetical protein